VGYDWGARAACSTAVLWPDEVGGLIPIGGYNVEDLALDRKPASARDEYMAWYQSYFHTERGKAGLEQKRRAICRLLWELWSPNWKFSDSEFDETAVSFENPDFVEIVIHSYQHRHEAAPGDPELEQIERRLVGQPQISVPAIVLHGDGDGVHPPGRSEGQEKLFSAYYERRLIPNAGHLFPREAPDVVANAVRDLVDGAGATGQRSSF
jgi:pimeloyl-ACP methyl ester carboxylesterase